MAGPENMIGQQIRPVDAAAAKDIANPLLRGLYRLWDAKRGSRPAPSRADFTVEELRP